MPKLTCVFMTFAVAGIVECSTLMMTVAYARAVHLASPKVAPPVPPEVDVVQPPRTSGDQDSGFLGPSTSKTPTNPEGPTKDERTKKNSTKQPPPQQTESSDWSVRIANLSGEDLLLVIATEDVMAGSVQQPQLNAEIAQFARNHSAKLTGGQVWVVTRLGMQTWDDFHSKKVVPDSSRLFAGNELPQACVIIREALMKMTPLNGRLRPIVVWFSPYVPQESEFHSTPSPIPAVLIWGGIASIQQTPQRFVTSLFLKHFPHGEEPRGLSDTLSEASQELIPLSARNVP